MSSMPCPNAAGSLHMNDDSKGHATSPYKSKLYTILLLGNLVEKCTRTIVHPNLNPIKWFISLVIEKDNLALPSTPQ